MNFFRYCIPVALLSVSASGLAQQLEPLETVENRVRPTLDAHGIRMGSFVLSPSLTAGAWFSDNVFADDNVSVEDFVYRVGSELSLESDWNNHFLGIDAEADIGRYDDNDDEDYEDFSIQADGRLNINRATYIAGGVELSQEHEDRSSAENIAGADLTEYKVGEASVTFFRQPNRFFLRLNALVRDTDFEDTRMGNIGINNDDRNRKREEQSVRIGYEFVPGSLVYVQGTVKSWEYEQEFDDDGFARSSDGYEVVLGAGRAISGVSSARAFVGFLSQDYDDPRFETVDGVSFGADVTWNITNIMTLNAEASRRIEPTGIFGASGINATSYGLTIDYELVRSLILSADVKISKDDYEGLSREDESLKSGFGIKFMLNRTLHVLVGYDYEQRDVRPLEFARDEYKINTAYIRLQGQM